MLARHYAAVGMICGSAKRCNGPVGGRETLFSAADSGTTRLAVFPFREVLQEDILLDSIISRHLCERASSRVKWQTA